MKTYARPLILVLGAAGLIASVLSLYVHYQFYSDPLYQSFCDVSETVSCEAVLQSQFATVAGIPVAAGGAIWSALVLLLAWYGMPASRSDTAGAVTGYIFVLSTVGLAAVLYLGYASFVVLQRMCLLCLTMYVSVIGIFLVSGAGGGSLSGLSGRVGRDFRALMASQTGTVIAASWAIASILLVSFFPRPEAPTVEAALEAPAAPAATLQGPELAQFEQWIDAQPRTELPIPDEGADVVIVKFNDYQCPACRQAYLEYRWIVEKYRASEPESVQFVTVDFPLDGECNTASIHMAACEAAAAVRMARERNRADEMEEWLFRNQATLTPDSIKQGVQQVADITDFDEQYPETLEEVRADAKIGQDLGISGTPTFFINGIRLSQALRPIYLDAAIAYELRKAQAAGSGTGDQGADSSL